MVASRTVKGKRKVIIYDGVVWLASDSVTDSEVVWLDGDSSLKSSVCLV